MIRGATLGSFSACQILVPATPTSFLEMIGTILVILLVSYFIWSMVSDFRHTPTPLANEPPVLIDFVPRTLQKYNGKDDDKVYLAVRGKVYDVTMGKQFYGPGGPYENFAGRDASRGLAYNSFDPSVLTPIEKPLDTLEDLSPEEKESLDNWESHFDGKYKLVGTLRNE